MNPAHGESSGLQKLLMLFGAILLLGGLAFIIVILSLTYEIINNPETSKVFQFVQGSLGSSANMISGEIDGKKIELALSPELRNISFLFLGVMAATMLCSIFNSLILTGATLLKQARKSEAETNSDRSHSNR